MTCHDCLHFNSRYETCEPLGGQVKCQCGRVRHIKESIGCQACAEVRGIDLALCPEGVPSEACPGRVEKEVEMKQGELF